MVERAVGVAEDQFVGHMKDDNTCGGQPGIATAIAQWLPEVVTTISFYGEASFLAEEVDEEWPDGMLTAELGLHQLPTP